MQGDNSEVIFGREKICKKFDISKDFFYKLSKVPGTPIKLIEGKWSCTVDQVADFIRKYPCYKSKDDADI